MNLSKIYFIKMNWCSQSSAYKQCFGHYILNSIKKIITAKGNLWPEALNSLKMTLGFEKNIAPEIANKINNLINELTPTDLKNQLFLKISKPEWDSYEKDDKGSYIDKVKINAEDFAKKLVLKNAPWTDNISELLQGEQRQAFNFGFKIGELSINIKDIIENAIVSIKTIPKEKQNPELIAGLIAGTKDKDLADKVIDSFIKDPDLYHYAFYLTRIFNSNYKGIQKLFVLINKPGFSISNFKQFQYGRALDNLSNDEVLQLCQKISKYGKEGRWVSLSLLYMFCYQNEQKWEQNIEFIKDLIDSDNMLIKNENSYRIESFHWSDSCEKILSNNNEVNFSVTVAKQIIEFCSQVNFNYSIESNLLGILKILFEKYFDMTWTYFGKALISDYTTFFHLKNLIGTKNGYFGNVEGLMFNSPEHYAVILEWCSQNPDKAPQRIANIIPLGISENYYAVWHPFSKKFIDEFGDDKVVLDQLTANMGTFGTVGSRVPYFTAQKQLLMALSAHHFESVRKWANGMLEYTEKEIRKEKLENEEDYM